MRSCSRSPHAFFIVCSHALGNSSPTPTRNSSPPPRLRYGAQYQYFQRIVAVYETEPDNFPRIVELMQVGGEEVEINALPNELPQNSLWIFDLPELNKLAWAGCEAVRAAPGGDYQRTRSW